MELVTEQDILQLVLPKPDSHKGQNGKLLVIGGSHLFHAASLWSLTVASRIVDLVHYSSVEENNEIVKELKKEFRNGIVIRREDLPTYIVEDDAVLIGPGMTRDEETEELTNTLLQNYPKKQWIIDAGALQMVNPRNIPENAILTPHHGEFERLEHNCSLVQLCDGKTTKRTLEQRLSLLTTTLHCIILLKGKEDIACSPEQCTMIQGGNAGMTKGGTGDVLAGLISALACTNDPFLATIAGSFVNKQAGDALYAKVGPFFNATDLTDQISETLKQLLIERRN